MPFIGGLQGLGQLSILRHHTTGKTLTVASDKSCDMSRVDDPDVAI